MCWITLNTWSFLEKCLEVIKTFSKFAIEKLILLKRRGLSQIQTAFAIEANWRHRQNDDANRRKEKPRRCKLTKTINFKLTQSTTQTDENTKTKLERLSLQIAFHTKPKIKNQTPKGVTGTRRRNCLFSQSRLLRVRGCTCLKCTNRASSAPTAHPIYLGESFLIL